jgi:hypothetical protein
VIRRVFAETAAGRTPREIARKLNAEGVPSPSGGVWNASTINGSRKRGNGVLRNELYVGQLVWNRQRMLKNPDTGRRVTKTNAAGDHMREEVPHLRIVPADVWERVQAIMTAKGGERPQDRRRPRYVFSGLVRCGQCGGSYVSIGGKYAKLGCSRRRERGDCDNIRAISVRIIEARILAALQDHLLDDGVVAEVMREYVAERRRLKANAERDASRRSRRLAEIQREYDRTVDAIAKGDLPSSAGRKLFALEEERTAIEAEAARQSPDVIEFHPALIEKYRRLVADLRTALAARDEESKAEIITSVRTLIDRVVVYPHDDPKGRDLELVGQLAGLMGTTGNPRSGMGALVAEEGLEPPTRGL